MDPYGAIVHPNPYSFVENDDTNSVLVHKLPFRPLKDLDGPSLLGILSSFLGGIVV